MKKLIAMLLCIAMVAALGVQAFAYSADDVETSKSQTAAESALTAAKKVADDKSTYWAEAATVSGKYQAAIKTYEDSVAAAKGDAAKIAKAKEVVTATVNALDAVYPMATYFTETTVDDLITKTAAGIKSSYVDSYSNKASAQASASAAISAILAEAKADGDKSRALKKIQEDYKGATGIKAQERDAMTTQLLASWAKADAEKAAKAAKDAVVAAQKSAVTTAKTEVAAAVANAQAKAYNELAAAYSAAVADLGTQLKEAIEGLH